MPIQAKRKTYNGVLGLVALALKVQIMLERVVLSALSDGRAMNGDVEFTPSLLIDSKRRLVEGWSAMLALKERLLRVDGQAAQHTLLGLRESWMQLVHDLFEDIGRHLLSLVVEKMYFDVPCAHRETLDLLWDIWQDFLLGDDLHLSFNLSRSDQKLAFRLLRMRGGARLTSGMFVCPLTVVSAYREVRPKARRDRVEPCRGWLFCWLGCLCRLVMVGGIKGCQSICVARIIYAFER